MSDDDLTLEEAFEELSSAEDFLSYFNIPFDTTVVHVNRLHIMQRFHDYLAQAEESMPDDDNYQALHDVYKKLLQRAYQDFVESDAVTEKVFKVFHMHEPQNTFVSVDQLLAD